MKRFAILLTLLFATTANAAEFSTDRVRELAARLSNDPLTKRDATYLSAAAFQVADKCGLSGYDTPHGILNNFMFVFDQFSKQRAGEWKPLRSQVATDMLELGKQHVSHHRTSFPVYLRAVARELDQIASVAPTAAQPTPDEPVPKPTPQPATFSPALVIVNGNYYLLLPDANGVPTLTKITQVVVLGEGGPTPTPNPTPTVDDQHRTAIRTALAKVTDPNKANVRTALAKLYATVAGLPVTERAQLVSSTDLLFNALGLSAEWTTWKAAADSSLARYADLDSAKRGWNIVAEVLGEK